MRTVPAHSFGALLKRFRQAAGNTDSGRTLLRQLGWSTITFIGAFSFIGFVRERVHLECSCTSWAGWTGRRGVLTAWSGRFCGHQISCGVQSPCSKSDR
jgi:hypothetical protein